MYAHDHHQVFYVKAGDRIYTIPLTELHAGYRRAQGLGNDGGMEPAGESPFQLDTAVIELAEFLCLDDGAPRQLVPVVGDVGQEVRVLAVGLHEDPVLVVAEVGAAQPGGAVLVEGDPPLAQVGEVTGV